MPAPKSSFHRLQKGTQQFVRELKEGVDSKGVQRLFDHEAAQAFRTLAGRRGDEPRPDDAFERFLEDVRDVARGFVLKLAPPRRVLFVFSILCPLMSLFAVRLDAGFLASLFSLPPFWFLVSIAGLTLLLALELVDRLRVRDELEVARQLQSDLLPSAAPVLPGWHIAHSYRTANEIGGDYYDFLPLPDGRCAIAVGDASGHGIGAGLLMAIGNAGLETAVELDPTPSAVLRLLGRTLFRTGGRRAFMTLFYGILDPDTGRFDWANAGHPFPILRRRDGTIEEIGAGSLPLGLRLEVEHPEGSVYLGDGDLLVLYSDGIPEAEGLDGNAFGFERLRAVIGTSHDARQAHDQVVETLRQYLGDRPLRDDVTLVAVSRTGDV